MLVEGIGRHSIRMSKIMHSSRLPHLVTSHHEDMSFVLPDLLEEGHSMSSCSKPVGLLGSCLQRLLQTRHNIIHVYLLTYMKAKSTDNM
jgi:hypothetical protein